MAVATSESTGKPVVFGHSMGGYVTLAFAEAYKRVLKGFSVVDEKGFQKDRKAFLQKDKVVIPINNKEKLVEVRYGWEPFTRANLVNAAGLPASTFKLKIQEVP